MTNPEAATFREMGHALNELGMSSQELGSAELLAHQLKERHGWSQSATEFAVIRMRRRQEVVAQAQMFFEQVSRWDAENLVRELTRQDPPRWGVIWKLTWAVLWTRWPLRWRLRRKPAA